MSLSYQHIFEPGASKTAPPLLLLHGTGGGERDLLRIGHTLSPGSALLSPRGDVSEGGARRFFARLAEGVFDPAEVTRRTHALADFISAATQHYGIEAARLTAVGFSNGANIAATLLLLRPESLGGAVLFRPMVVLDQAPAQKSLLAKRVLIHHGTNDPIVPPDHPQRLAFIFRSGGADVTLQTLPASHALTPEDVAGAVQWLHPSG